MTRRRDFIPRFLVSLNNYDVLTIIFDRDGKSETIDFFKLIERIILFLNQEEQYKKYLIFKILIIKDYGEIWK